MDYNLEVGNPIRVITSGTGVIGVSGRPCNLLGIYVGACSGPIIGIYSGTPTAFGTMAYGTFTANAFTRLPYASPNGITYQVQTGAGDSVLSLTFFWVPSQGS